MADIRWMAPIPEPTAEGIVEVLESQQITREFYAEIHYRDKFEQYCQRYYATAAKHRQELAKMQGDINILGWFFRGRRS